MGLIKCKECGAMVSEHASSCPYCGADCAIQTSPIMMGVLYTLGGIVFITSGICLLGYGFLLTILGILIVIVGGLSLLLGISLFINRLVKQNDENNEQNK